MLLDRGAARPGRRRLPADGRDRHARGARDAARADRRAARRPLAGRAAAAPGRRRARQDVHRARARGPRRDAGAPSSGRSSQGSSARRCSRVQTDPRSPERGQYGFLQDLVRHVAYETLARRERRTRHLAAAGVPRAELGEDEVAEVIAAHYVAALEAAPDAEDAGRDHGEGARRADARRRARAALARIGRGAALLPSAPRSSPTSRSTGDAARPGGAGGAPANVPRRGARVARARHRPVRRGRTGERGAACPPGSPSSTTSEGHAPQAVARLESALEALAEREPDAHVAAVAGQLGRFLVLSGEGHRGASRTSSRRSRSPSGSTLPEVLSQALNTKGASAAVKRSPERSADPARRRARDRAGARAPVGGAPRLQQPRLGARAAGPHTRVVRIVRAGTRSGTRAVGDRGQGDRVRGQRGVRPVPRAADGTRQSPAPRSSPRQR